MEGGESQPGRHIGHESHARGAIQRHEIDSPEGIQEIHGSLEPGAGAALGVVDEQ